MECTDKYDFDTPIDRTNTQSLKWDVAENELPMWVADMDFKTVPAVTKRLQKAVEHGIYGYSDSKEDYFAAVSGWYRDHFDWNTKQEWMIESWNEAVAGWWSRRHNWDIDKDWLVFCTGVIPSVSSIVRKLTTPNENVVIQTPVYNIFFNSIINNGRRVLENPLRYENGEYSIDWEDLKNKLANPQTSLMILCNPQNPSGKIWSKEDLSRIGELCARYYVTVVSDEIHCDLTDPGKEYIPFASVSDVCRDISITCVAPTKTFNIAGLQTAAVIVPHKNLRHKVWRALNTDEVAEPNAFAVWAAEAAYNYGDKWLDELRGYIYNNKRIVNEYVNDNITSIKVVQSEATYLLWLDCSAITDNSSELAAYIRNRTGLYLSAGNVYGGNGNQFLRLNIACPKAVLMDGLKRLEEGIRLAMN